MEEFLEETILTGLKGRIYEVIVLKKVNRPEAGIDDTGIQPFVICDFILYLHSKIWSLESTICPRSLDSMFFIGCY